MTDAASFKPARVKPSIAFSELDRIDIRVGTILSVEDVEGSDKLVRLKVDFGDHTRNILVGMKQERQPAGDCRPAGALCRQSRTEEDDGRNFGGDAL